MIQNRNIICFASNWFYDPTSKHHLMRLLSRDNHVIWVNYHASRRPSATLADARAAGSKLRQFIDGPRRVSENMTVITPIVLPLPGHRIAARLNRSLLDRQIRRVLESLPRRPIQLWTFSPDVDQVCGRFGEECILYYCVDAFSEFTGYDARAVLDAERRLCEKADLVVTTSTALHEAKSPLCRRAALVTHGVDGAHFAGAVDAAIPPPKDVADLPRPIMGFWGLLQDWFDVDLIAGAAGLRPEWSFVLIGEAAVDVSPLRRMPNVHLLGRRRYSDLPAYARAFDVGLIPFRVNNLTRAVNPIKLREYLSAGLPVVSTPMPEVERYDDLIELAAPDRAGEPVGSAFIAACERALARRSAEDIRRRQSAMSRETWEAKLAELESHVEAAISNRSSAVVLAKIVNPA